MALQYLLPGELITQGKTENQASHSPLFQYYHRKEI